MRQLTDDFDFDGIVILARQLEKQAKIKDWGIVEYPNEPAASTMLLTARTMKNVYRRWQTALR